MERVPDKTGARRERTSHRQGSRERGEKKKKQRQRMSQVEEAQRHRDKCENRKVVRRQNLCRTTGPTVNLWTCLRLQQKEEPPKSTAYTWREEIKF